MANDIQIFSNPQFGEIRTAIGENGEPMFCLPDLCKALELTNPRSVKARLDEADVQLIDLHAVNPNDTIVGNSMANFITESGFYDVILQSSSPKVKPFRKWVTSEVLPTIRKHGAYMTQDVIERTLQDPDYLIRLATTLKEEKQKRIEAESVAAWPLASYTREKSPDGRNIGVNSLTEPKSRLREIEVGVVQCLN